MGHLAVTVSRCERRTRPSERSRTRRFGTVKTWMYAFFPFPKYVSGFQMSFSTSTYFHWARWCVKGMYLLSIERQSGEFVPRLSESKSMIEPCLSKVAREWEIHPLLWDLENNFIIFIDLNRSIPRFPTWLKLCMAMEMLTVVGLPVPSSGRIFRSYLCRTNSNDLWILPGSVRSVFKFREWIVDEKCMWNLSWRSRCLSVYFVPVRMAVQWFSLRFFLPNS